MENPNASMFQQGRSAMLEQVIDPMYLFSRAVRVEHGQAHLVFWQSMATYQWVFGSPLGQKPMSTFGRGKLQPKQLLNFHFVDRVRLSLWFPSIS